MQATTDKIERSDPADRMQCMEVWGGNCRVDRHFDTAGLESWIYSHPHGGAAGGGDVYYVSSCASGRITRMLLADVSGHGSEASETAVRLRDLMRANVNFIRQTQFVQAMNQQFAEISSSERFATALVCSYFSPTHTLDICNAGHPQPLLYRERDNLWTSVEHEPSHHKTISDTPLGVAEQATYSQTETRLHPGDLLLFFSDALIESLGSNGRPLGSLGVYELVASLDTQEPASFISKLTDSIRSLHPQNLTDDDTTIFLIRANASSPTLKDNLLAPVRLARRTVRDRTSLRYS